MRSSKCKWSVEREREEREERPLPLSPSLEENRDGQGQRPEGQRWARPETRGPENQRTREPENQILVHRWPRGRHHAITPIRPHHRRGGDRRSEIKRPENQRTREPDPPTPSDPLNPPSSDTVLVHRGSPSKRHQNHQNHQNGASKPSKHHENVIRTVRTIRRPSEDHQKTIRRTTYRRRAGCCRGPTPSAPPIAWRGAPRH